MRGVTEVRILATNETAISTHTPHARRDARIFDSYGGAGDFNSHASCEA